MGGLLFYKKKLFVFCFKLFFEFTNLKKKVCIFYNILCFFAAKNNLKAPVDFNTRLPHVLEFAGVSQANRPRVRESISRISPTTFCVSVRHNYQLRRRRRRTTTRRRPSAEVINLYGNLILF